MEKSAGPRDNVDGVTSTGIPVSYPGSWQDQKRGLSASHRLVRRDGAFSHTVTCRHFVCATRPESDPIDAFQALPHNVTEPVADVQKAVALITARGVAIADASFQPRFWTG